MSSDRPLIIDPTKLGDIDRVLPTPTSVSAQASGFSSNSHLTHHFKRLVGVTPQVARSQDRAN